VFNLHVVIVSGIRWEELTVAKRGGFKPYWMLHQWQVARFQIVRNKISSSRAT